MKTSGFFGIGFLFMAAASALGQSGARRELATPGLVVETGYRTGALDVLVFTPEGKYLLATGDDKVVRTWKLTGAKLEVLKEAPGEPKGVLRWPTMREHRGNIYAAALSADGRHVAVGGVGLKDSQLAILDRFEGTTKAILDTVSKDKGGFNIRALAYSPSGKLLVAGGTDGSVWHWDGQADGGTRIGVHPSSGNANNDIGLIHFLNEREFISGDSLGQLLKWRVDGGAPQIVAKLGEGFGAWRYKAFGSKIAIALRTNRVLVLHLDQGNRVQRILLPSAHVPSALAFDPKTGRLAIAASVVDLDADFHKEVGQNTFLVDLDAPTLRPGPSASYRVEGLAFHPDKDLLALGGGNHHEITLWKQTDGWEKTSHLESPGRSIYGLRLSSNGSLMAYQEDRHPDAAHPNQRGKGPWKVFDLKARKFLKDQSVPRGFGTNITEQDGWKVVTTRASGWSVRNTRTGKKLALPFEFGQFGLPLCYSFLPQLEEGKVHLAVGHIYGVSIFELTPDRARRVRYLIGHDGEVYCLAVARTEQGLLLVTGGRDQTIAGWALDPFKSHPLLGAQLLPRGARLVVGNVDPQSPGWEVGLSKGDEIVGLWMVGVKKDRHEPVFLRGDVNFLTGKKSGPVGTGPEVLEHLERHSAGNEMVFIWNRPGHKGLLGEKTTLKERPVWRFFPTKDREWVLWRVSDYFYDCSTAGDLNIGWHVNSFTGKGYDIYATPRFYSAERMRKLYHQPAKISQTLSTWARQETVVQTGQTAEAVKAGGERVPVESLDLIPLPGQQVRFANHDSVYVAAEGATRTELMLQEGLARAVPPGTRIDVQGLVPFQTLEPPQVEVQLLSKSVVKDSDPVISIRVRPRSGRENQELTRVQIWINDYLYERLEGDGLKLQVEKDAAGDPIRTFQAKRLAIPHSLLRSGKNRILVQGFNRADSRSDGTPIVVTLDRPRGEAVFHGLLVGVGDYSKVTPNPGRNVDLKADLDVEALARVFELYAGEQYPKTNIIAMTNKDVTPDAVFAHLTRLAKEAHPDDMLLFKLAGHGLNLADTAEVIAQNLKGGERSFTPRHLEVFRQQARGMGKFVFMCGNFDMERLADTTLRIDQLQEHLAKIPCQKVIFLDACHSGAVEPPTDALGKIIYPESMQSPDNQHANDLIRLLAPDQVGPIIFQACGPKEAALELRGLTNVDKLYGLFSQAIVETIVERFDQADTNKNGGLEGHELHAHVVSLIPEFLEDFRKRNPELAESVSEQNPRLFLPEFSRDFIIVRPAE